MGEKQLHMMIIGLVLMFTGTACTKSKVDTRRFMKQGRWMVTELTIGSNTSSSKPSWDIEKSEDSQEFTGGTWHHSDGSTAKFKWRFNYFEGGFSFYTDGAAEQEESSKAFMQCDNLSGDYIILEDKMKLFQFQSKKTNGYLQTPVFIQIEPQ